MHRIVTCIALALAPLPAAAWDQAAMKRLKDTGECAGCDLGGGDLRWANVYEAELAGAPNLVNADLAGANLAAANLYGANLEGARLAGADLTGAVLSWSNMNGADLTGAQMDGARLDGAIFCRTTMPDGSQNDANC